MAGTEWAKWGDKGWDQLLGSRASEYRCKEGLTFSHKNVIVLYIRGLLLLCAMWETDCRDQVCGYCSEWEFMMLYTKMIKSSSTNDAFPKMTHRSAEVYRKGPHLGLGCHPWKGIWFHSMALPKWIYVNSNLALKLVSLESWCFSTRSFLG